MVVVAGRYELRPDGIGSFVYARSYLERDAAFSLDPRHLPLSAREFRTTRNHGMFGALRDVAPDAWGRLIMQRRGTPETELDFLLATSDARVGALSFAPTPDVPPLDLSDVLTLDAIAPTLRASDHLQARIAGEPVVPAFDPDLLEPGSSLGGARPKANVMDERGQLWIAKFPARNDAWDNAVVELGCLRLAGECG
ncbi:MAG: HipA N-terminal domain-containing protein, partial [Phycisphaerales bacterium]|nr:HipA N-terminal domain-containing protein [Phycisphaerales bacterium]